MGRERVPLSHSSFTVDCFTWNSIKKNRRCTRREDELHPLHPIRSKTFVFHDRDHCLMLNFIKSFLKVQFENQKLLSGFMTEVQILNSPGNTILNGSRFNEAILILMDDRLNNSLKSVGQKFSDDLHGGV